MKLAALFLLLAAILPAHVISMSTGEFRVTGNKASYELRMPIYEIQHVKGPEKALFEQIHFKSNGVEGRLTEKQCAEDKSDASYRCKASYEWSAPVEEVEIQCGFHTITVPNHVHLVHAYRDDKTDQAVFDFSNTQQLIRFRPPTAFETWMTAMGSGFARVFSSAASVLFLFCLVLAARSTRELLLIVAMFLAGEILAAVVVPQTLWNPAPRFVESALALTVAYLAVEILLLPQAGQRWLVAGALGAFHGLSFALYLVATAYWSLPVLSGMALGDLLAVAFFAFLMARGSRMFPSVAPTALKVSASLLLATGLVWFFVRLRT